VKTKWYFGGLVAFMLLYVVSQQRETIPNQEIKFEFSEVVSSQEISSLLNHVELQLKAVGATQINVVTDVNGKIKLNYFSEQSAVRIEYLLRHTDKYNASQLSLAKAVSKSTIKLDVYDINKPLEPTSGFDDTIIIEHKSEFDRFVGAKTYANTDTIKYIDLALAIQSNKVLKENTIVFLSSTLHNLPEVRAGPLA
jgi:hypothetical protein